MPLQEKFSYKNSIDYCDSFGFKNHPDDPTGEKLQIKLIESLKKTWTTDPSCTRRKWTETREFSCYLYFELAQNQIWSWWN